MTFEVDYGGIPAGDIAFAVGNIGHDAGRTEVVISSRINSSGVAALIKHIEDCTTTTVDVASGRPVVVESAAQYGDVSGSAHASYEGSIVDVQSKRASDAKPQRMHFDLHGDIAYDAHTAMAIIRGWHGVAGEHRSLWVVGGKRLWRTDFQWGGPATIETKFGNRAAIRIESQAYHARANRVVDEKTAPRTMTLWLSDDDDRVPLRVVAHTEIADATVELTEYQRP